MAHYRRTVTSAKKNNDQIPSWAAAGVALFLYLIRHDQLSEVEERLKIRREGGYVGIDVFMFLVYYFAAGLRKGLKPFWYQARAYKKQLAAVAGRKQLPSSTAISRALKAVEADKLRDQTAWLLGEATGIETLLHHPAVQTYDALGQGWHVFDYDPTVTVLRQRALPAGEDLPEPKRRSAEMAAGHSGRKRGDVQLRRATLQHSGSGAWLFVMLNPGNGDSRNELSASLKVAVDTCKRIEHPLERALVRADGEYGNVPQISSFIEHNVNFITRLNRSALLNNTELHRRLVEAQWELVPDSKSGPSRSAADIGIITLKPAAQSLQDDGSDYAPVTVRVVVSRFPNEKKAGRGKVIAGWQYELYATSLDHKAWPAAEVVASYYGRTGIENRFAQEDRELMLDRIFSYHLPGQEFATVIGLMLWNSRIALGFELEPPPWEKPKQRERTVQVDTRPVPPETCEVEKNVIDFVEKKLEPMVNLLTEVETELISMLGELPWQQMLIKRGNWSWDVKAGLHCPNNQRLNLTCIHSSTRKARIIFRGKKSTCYNCEHLKECFNAKSTVTKQVTFSANKDDVLPIKEHLGKVQHLRKQCTTVGRELALASAAIKNPLITPLDDSSDFLLACLPSLFLPATARRHFDSQVRDLTTYIQLTLPPAPIPHPSLLARSEADRQHRRLTWAEHRQRYALPDGADLNIVFAGGRRLVRLLRGQEAPDSQAVIA